MCFKNNHHLGCCRPPFFVPPIPSPSHTPGIQLTHHEAATHPRGTLGYTLWVNREVKRKQPYSSLISTLHMLYQQLIVKVGIALDKELTEGNHTAKGHTEDNHTAKGHTEGNHTAKGHTEGNHIAKGLTEDNHH